MLAHIRQANQTRRKMGLTLLAEPDTAPPPEGSLELPFYLSHVWEQFMDIQFPAQSNGFGPLPLTFTEIAEWTRLTGQELLPWEVDCFRKLSAAYVASVAHRQKEQREKTKR
jgi:hypothetical protein